MIHPLLLLYHARFFAYNSWGAGLVERQTNVKNLQFMIAGQRSSVVEQRFRNYLV